MKKLFSFVLLLALVLNAAAQLQSVQPASSAEVLAGTEKRKFVSPATLSTYSLASPTNGVTAGQVTNIVAGALTNNLPDALLDTGLVFTPDTAGFTTTNAILFNRGALNGGRYLALQTNISGLFTGLVWGSTNRFHFGLFTNGYAFGNFSDMSVSLTFNPSPGDADPPYPQPNIEMSSDGISWTRALPNISPVYISVSFNTNSPAVVTNLYIYSFANPRAVGRTNNLTSQTIYVTQTDDGASVVNVVGAEAIAAEATTLWANSPAVTTVNLDGYPLQFSPQWQCTILNQTLSFTASGTEIFSATPAASAGTTPNIVGFTLDSTNVTLRIIAAETPVVEWKPDLAGASWTNLASQTASQSVGTWFVTAPKPNQTNAFFRAYTSGTNSVAGLLKVNGSVLLKAATKPTVTGTDVALWNSNGVTFKVTASTATPF